MEFYAGICGWTLDEGARSLWRRRAAIAAYLGDTDDFNKAIVAFSERYADQNELDFTAFTDAINSGRLDATQGI